MLELEEKQRETKVKSNVAQSPGNITAPRNMVLYWVTILPVYLGFGDWLFINIYVVCFNLCTKDNRLVGLVFKEGPPKL